MMFGIAAMPGSVGVVADVGVVVIAVTVGLVEERSAASPLWSPVGEALQEARTTARKAPAPAAKGRRQRCMPSS